MSTDYEPRWYWCDLIDQDDQPDEPDWSRVPADRREEVRAGWLKRSAPKPERVKLWGPQIEWYQSLPYYDVTVIGPVELVAT